VREEREGLRGEGEKGKEIEGEREEKEGSR
jgi:hypothetical protein